MEMDEYVYSIIDFFIDMPEDQQIVGILTLNSVCRQMGWELVYEEEE